MRKERPGRAGGGEEGIDPVSGCVVELQATAMKIRFIPRTALNLKIFCVCIVYLNYLVIGGGVLYGHYKYIVAPFLTLPRRRV